jgi:phosphoglycerate dehydrogenase-like enzyme
MSERVLVLFKTAEPQREILREVLGGNTAFEGAVFLEDLTDSERRSALEQAEIILAWNLPRELRPEEYGLLTHTRLLQLVSAGADHVPYDRLRSEMTIAANVGAYAEPMAEHVLALIYALAKRIIPAHEELRTGVFNRHTPSRMVAGSTCAVLGFGGIGRAAARLLHPLGVRILGVNRSGASEEPAERVGTLTDLEEILREADIVVIALPLNRFTRGLIGPRQFAWMRSDAMLINVARGEIVNEEALYEHLRSHPEFRVGIDAWWVEPFREGEFRVDHPFFELPNVAGSPHNSALVPGILDAGLRRAAENIRRFLSGKPPAGIVRREDYTTTT